MRLWQSAMIGLAKSEKVTAAMQASPFMQRFASQFIGGTDASQALETVTRLRQRGLRTTLFYLGEYIRDANLVEQCTAELLQLLPKLIEVGSDAHISVDPTQMGASIEWSLCVHNVQRLADEMANLATPKRKVLMIDMEDSSLTQGTIERWRSLHTRGYPVAITIQAYLRRSEQDVRRLVEAGAAVRLVKGALAETEAVA
ncbi:MAG TPA: proline dehydrogenase family protein, partial [Polyangiaceae bacterium]